MIESYNIEGRIVNHRTKEPISNVVVALNKNDSQIFSTKSNDKGIYMLEAKLDLGEIVESFSKLELKYTPPSKSKYSTETYIPLTLRGELKTSIPPIEMKSAIKSDLDSLVSKVSKIPDDIIKSIENKVNNKDAMDDFFKKSIDNIFSTMMPVVASLLMEFGVEKLGSKKKSCPTPDNLLNVVKRRNNIVRGLNNLYKSLDIVIKAYNASLFIIRLFELVKKVKINAPIPIFKGTLQSVIHIKAELIRKTQKDIDKYKGISENVILYVFILRGLIGTLLGYLKNIDNNIGDCLKEYTINPFGNEDYLEPIIDDIKAIYVEEKKEIPEYIKTYHNGFEIKVINSENNPIQGLFRRQAVALDPQQIIVLRGEPSFSSSDEILKNELIFYINVNQLKTY